MDLYQHFIALSQIIIIDFVLAGDNAIVVGMTASRVHPSMRARVILWGIGGAVVLRILFATIAMQLLGHRRALPRGRHSIALGLLEDVPRDQVARAGQDRARGSLRLTLAWAQQKP